MELYSDLRKLPTLRFITQTDIQRLDWDTKELILSTLCEKVFGRENKATSLHTKYSRMILPITATSKPSKEATNEEDIVTRNDFVQVFSKSVSSLISNLSDYPTSISPPTPEAIQSTRDGAISAINILVQTMKNKGQRRTDVEASSSRRNMNMERNSSKYPSNTDRENIKRERQMKEKNDNIYGKQSINERGKGRVMHRKEHEDVEEQEQEEEKETNHKSYSSGMTRIQPLRQNNTRKVVNEKSSITKTKRTITGINPSLNSYVSPSIQESSSQATYQPLSRLISICNEQAKIMRDQERQLLRMEKLMRDLVGAARGLRDSSRVANTNNIRDATQDITRTCYIAEQAATAFLSDAELLCDEDEEELISRRTKRQESMEMMLDEIKSIKSIDTLVEQVQDLLIIIPHMQKCVTSCIKTKELIDKLDVDSLVRVYGGEREEDLKYLSSNFLDMESLVLPDADAALQNLQVTLKRILGQQVYDVGEALDDALEMFKI